MWPFPKRQQALDEAHLALIAQIHGLVQRVKHLEEGLAAAEAAHERLRGRFYATRGKELELDKPVPLTKEQILARFVPPRRG